jgi:formyltetrahydrofolate deformylase
VNISFEPTKPPVPDVATLLVSCTDRHGLVAALAQVLTGHGANILAADQHRNEQVGQFFQRIRFDLSELLTDRGTLERALHEVARRFGMDLRLFYDSDVPRVAIFVSQYDHCLFDLLWRYRSGELPCSIPLIISNRSDLAVAAEQMKIPFVVVPITPGDKLSQEAKEIERGVKLIGATAHYATEHLDEGPIIEQDVIRATHKDSVRDLIRKGRDVERNVLGRAVRWHLEHRVLVHQNRTVVFE